MSCPVIIHSLRAVRTQHCCIVTAPRSRNTLHCRSVPQGTRRRQLLIRCSSSNGANKEADDDMDLLAAE